MRVFHSPVESVSNGWLFDPRAMAQILMPSPSCGANVPLLIWVVLDMLDANSLAVYGIVK